MAKIPKIPTKEEVFTVFKDVFKHDFRRQKEWTKDKSSKIYVENLKKIYDEIRKQRREQFLAKCEEEQKSKSK